MDRSSRILGIIVAFAFAVAAHADEPVFGYTYTTDLLPRGKWEVEQWFSLQERQSRGTYHNLFLRTEVEHGITDNFQAAFYVNNRSVRASGNSVTGETEGLDIPGDHDPATSFSGFDFEGVSLELMYRVLSPYKDKVGLVLYAEPEVGPDERALELRLILQKNFLDDTLILAGNFWVEPEREKELERDVEEDGEVAIDTEYEKATMAELDLGISYRFAPGWFGGIEYRNHNEFLGYTLAHGNQEHMAHFVGPTIHYGGQRWFATLTALRQVHATPYTDEQRENTVGHKIYGHEHALWDGIRLKMGVTF
ncbi:MAG: DUF6662 family protein [Acidobacteriota bacterium]